MAMIKDCLQYQVKAGKVSQKAVDDYLTRLKDAEAKAQQAGMDGVNAYLHAASTTAVDMVERAKNRRNEVVQTILSVDRVWEQAGQHNKGRFLGLINALGENIRGEAAGQSIATRAKAVYGVLQRFNAEFIEQARSKLAGLTRDVETPRNVVRELYGESTGEGGAGTAAKAWSESTDYAVKLLRSAGVRIGQLEDWRLPQKFDQLAVQRLGKDNFVAQLEKWWREGKLRLRDWEADGTAYLAPGRVREATPAAPTPATSSAAPAASSGPPTWQQVYGKMNPQAFVGEDPKLAGTFRKNKAGDEYIVGMMQQAEVRLLDGSVVKVAKGADTIFDGQRNIIDPHAVAAFKNTTPGADWVPVQGAPQPKATPAPAASAPAAAQPTRAAVTDDVRVRDILNRAFDNITRNAGTAIEPGVSKRATLSDRYGRRRAFEWATADDWLEFNRTMGVGDDGIFDLMVSHLKHLSSDIALAQVLGPDPNAAAKTLIAMGARDGLSPARVRFLENIYAQSSGRASTPVGEKFATIAQGVRNWLAASQLGGAILSAVTDLGFVKATAGWNGLSSTRIAGEYLSGLNPANRTHRLEAARRGLILEVGLRTLSDGARDSMADAASRLPGRVAEVVMRAQGLAIHTQAMRDAFGLEFQAHFADLAQTAFASLPAREQRTLRTYGISEAEWDILRAKAVEQPSPGVAPFMDPARLAAEGTDAEREAALKFMGAIAAEQRYAVPEGNTISRALLLGQSQPGTLGGEFRRSVAQYKSFPIAVMLAHGGRALDNLANPDGSWFKGSYLAGMIISLTSLGALSINLKNLAQGKDAEAMDFTKPDHAIRFWGRALMQGGGAGIFGDFLQNAVSARSGKDMVGTLIGPTLGFFGDVSNLALGNPGQYFRDEKTNVGRDAVRFANRYTPDLFYTRLAMDRIVWDSLQKMVDPEAHGTFQRMIQRARKDQDVGFWWAPGRTEPSRTPRIPQLGLTE